MTDKTGVLDVLGALGITEQDGELIADTLAQVSIAAAESATAIMGVMIGRLRVVEAERDRLRDALKLAYFHLGPPQPRLDDPADVPALVELAVAERDRLRRLVYLIYRSTHDRPIDEIDWLTPWARDLLGETIETVKRETAAQLDGSEVMGDA